jgi:hypothetical protein
VELQKYVLIDPYLLVFTVAMAFPLFGLILGFIWVIGANIVLQLFGGLTISVVDVDQQEKPVVVKHAVLKGQPKQSNAAKASPQLEDNLIPEPVMPLEAAPQPISMGNI